MSAERLTRYAAPVLAAAIVAVASGMSLVRAWRGEFDFSHFYAEGRYVWEHRALNPEIDATGGDAGRRLPFYLPSVAAIIAPLTSGGQPIAAALWALLQGLSLAVSLRLLLTRWLTGPPAAQVAFLLLALPAIYEAAKFNQLSFPVLALILLTFRSLERRADFAAGVALASAVVFKLLPALLLPWLVLKRRWWALAATAACGVALAVVPPILAYGPVRAAGYYAEWWRLNIQGDSARGLVNPERREHFIDHRNQSIQQVVARWTWAGHPHAMPSRLLNLAQTHALIVAKSIAIALAILLLAAVRRPWKQLAAHRRTAEFAAVAIAMLALSPLVRQYYLVWAMPGLAVLAGWAFDAASRRRLAGWIGLALWIAGLAAWLSPEARLAGAHLVMLVLLGAVLLVPDATERERPA